MNNEPIAIIGSTASGKSSLSIEVAKKYNGIILSLDSLSVYKQIDIASAKPSKNDLSIIKHFGINEVYPDTHFNILDFSYCYFNALKYAKDNNKNLIIVGGTSFYLKSLIDGLSPYPKISKEAINKTKEQLKDKKQAYELLKKVDKNITIHPNDTYRIEKHLNIYFETNNSLREFNIKNPKEKIIKENIKIFNLYIEKDILDKQIKLRTKNMIKNGLLDEISYLKNKYNNDLKAMKSIGIKETISYLNKEINKQELEDLIIKNTKSLAKRQKTFNKTQFNCVIGDISKIRLEIDKQWEK
jgi:tRNA dimethylallyltransferase